MAKKTDREKLNKLVEKRKKAADRIKKLKSKKKAPLKKLRTKIQETRKKKIQKKINKNPKAIEDRKKAMEKKKKMSEYQKRKLEREKRMKERSRPSPFPTRKKNPRLKDTKIKVNKKTGKPTIKNTGPKTINKKKPNDPRDVFFNKVKKLGNRMLESRRKGKEALRRRNIKR